MRTTAAQLMRWYKKSGDKIAALFCVALLAFALAVVGFTRVYIANRDSLLRFAPAQSALYAHASGSATHAMLSVYDENLAALRAHEAAIVALPDGSEYVLLGWTFPFAPSADARRVLEGLHSIQLTHRVFVVPIATKEGSDFTEDTASLSAYAQTRRALATVRSGSAIQVFIGPALLHRITNGLGSDIAERKQMNEPVVAGVQVRPNGFTAFMIPEKEAAKMKSLIVRSSRPPQRTRTSVAQGAPGADITLSGAPIPFELLFPSGETAQNAGSSFTEAKTTLQQLLDPQQLTLSLFAPKTTDDHLGFALHLPYTPPSVLIPAFEAFAATNWPQKEPLILPDGDTASEFTVDKERVLFTQQNSASHLSPQPGLEYTIYNDSKNGSILLNKASLLPVGILFTPIKAKKCPIQDSETFVHINSLPIRENVHNNTQKLLAYLRTNSLLINKNVDNLVIFCGYRD